jgi:hypothetical protein
MENAFLDQDTAMETMTVKATNFALRINALIDVLQFVVQMLIV